MRIGILTVSDLGAIGERADTSGDAIVQWAGSHGYEVVVRSVVADETDRIAGKLARWADSGEVDVILTTGGDGGGGRAARARDRRGAARWRGAAVPARLALPRASGHARHDADRQPPGVDRRRGGRARRARRLSRSRGRAGNRSSYGS